MWIFGYGSLTWKADFPHVRRVPGCIKGFSRRFWQASEDHRGIPGNPGRVVTLVSSENSEECVWGVAYEVSTEDESKVAAYLDYREKDGYEKTAVTFHPRDEALEPFLLSVYIGGERNPFFLGPASVETIAAQIYRAEGPSGKNLDYLFNLAESMRRIAPQVDDPHLYEIEFAVRRLCQNG